MYILHIYIYIHGPYEYYYDMPGTKYKTIRYSNHEWISPLPKIQILAPVNPLGGQVLHLDDAHLRVVAHLGGCVPLGLLGGTREPWNGRFMTNWVLRCSGICSEKWYPLRFWELWSRATTESLDSPCFFLESSDAYVQRLFFWCELINVQSRSRGVTCMRSEAPGSPWKWDVDFPGIRELLWIVAISSYFSAFFNQHWGI